MLLAKIMTADSDQSAQVRYQGIVTRIIFTNPKEFFHIFAIRTNDGQNFSVKGSMQTLKAGSRVEVFGSLEETKYGQQINASYLENMDCKDGVCDGSLNGIIEFLSSDLIKGIGKVVAKRIVDQFKGKTLEVIEKTPELMTEVKGITPKKANLIHVQVVEQLMLAKLMQKLGKYGITAKMMSKVNAAFGSKAIVMINENPYCLCRVSGIGFKMADQFAQSAGVPLTDESRLTEGVKFVLRETVSQGGSCGLLKSELISRAIKILEVEKSLVEKAIETVSDSGEIITENDICYDRLAWNAEESIARHLKRIMSMPPLVRDDESILQFVLQAESIKGITLSDTQRRAVITSIKSPVSVITGQPGTGKTTIVQVLLESLKLMGEAALSIGLAAPTGKAANRIAETCGYGMTQHRLLGAKGPGSFEFDEDNRLDCTTLIIDEFSMNDVFLANATFRALNTEARLVVVGDINQLPSVGPGQVLGDMIASRAIPSTRLTEIRRQGDGSGIVIAAAAINAGNNPVTNTERNDFIVMIDSDPASKMLRVVRRMLQVGDRPNDIQVLSPMKTGNAGVKNMNKLLQPILNPNANADECGNTDFIERYDTKYFVGDRVMQLKNNYDFGIFNGDVGYVIEVDVDAGAISVQFDAVTVELCGSMLDTLTLSYACTVHKYQGSECKNVIMPITTSHFMMLKRNLIYTGITRARNRMVLVVEPYKNRDLAALSMGVKKVETDTRISRLAKLLGGAQKGVN